MSKASDRERESAIAKLRDWLTPGDTVYTILRSHSRSGMSRTIGLVLLRDGADLHPNWAAATAIGMPLDRHREGIRVGGCGMDMGFHLVYELSSVLFRDGFDCLGDRCPSNDHSNYRKGGPPCPTHHTDGGYALRHRWL